MMTTAPVQQAVNMSHISLERQIIIDFLAEKGYCLHDLNFLPEEEAAELMSGACIYASLRLAEIEARSQFRRKIHFKD